MTRVAVIGAGLSGLVVGRELQDEHNTTVFEKSRGGGGRMATRYENGFEFDFERGRVEAAFTSGFGLAQALKRLQPCN